MLPRGMRLLLAVVGAAALVAGCWYIFSGSYRVGLRAELVTQEGHAWVRGSELVHRDPADLAKQYGFRIIHQSWKTERIPVGLLTANFISWSTHHPTALHVLWTNEDNHAMMRAHYPELAPLYFSPLLTPVQQSDVARVAYLHRYGGVYADLDYEARTDLFANLPETEARILIARSPTLLNEVMQNSLMIAKEPKLEFWYRVLQSTSEVIHFIGHPEECFKHKWSGCNDLMMFHNPLTRKIVNVVMSSFMTGPALLDRTFALYRSSGWDPKWQIHLLPLDKFFIGSVAKHYQLSTWVSILYVAREIIGLIVLAVIGAVALGAFGMRWFLLRGAAGSGKLVRE